MKKEVLRNEANPEKIKSSYSVELVEAFKTEGCPVCRLLDRYIEQYFENLLYEFTNDPGVRRAIRDALGYCEKHTAQLIKIADKTYQRLSISIIAEDITRKLLERYCEVVYQGKKSVFAEKESSKICPACLYQTKHEKFLISEMAKVFRRDEYFDEIKINSGLCVKHIRQYLDMEKNPQIAKKVIENQTTILKKINSELNGFIKKHDYRNKEKITESEANAWRKTLEIVAKKSQ
jgi:hypothetical protein